MLLFQNRTSLYNMSFGQIEVLIDGFDRSFCFMSFWLDMTCSEAGHRPVWSYVLRSSYVRYCDIRVALVLERRWHILCLSKHRCRWTRPLPYAKVHSSRWVNIDVGIQTPLHRFRNFPNGKWCTTILEALKLNFSALNVIGNWPIRVYVQQQKVTSCNATLSYLCAIYTSVNVN